MKKIKNMSLEELAAFVSTQLKNSGIECVLTGGACVSIYSKNRYQSFDFDFIESGYYKRDEIADSLKEIGFFEENRYFKNNETDFFIEFPKGPLSVGNEPVKEVIEKSFDTGKLKLISPTDCIKDRLAGYYHWNDLQCLEQAILVAENNAIDIDEIRRWSIEEGKEPEFNKIKDKLKSL